MSAPSSRREPAAGPDTPTSSRRTTRGGAPATEPAVTVVSALEPAPAGSLVAPASTRETRPARSVARPAAPVRSGLDDRGVRRSTRGAAGSHRGGMVTRRSTPPPERDRFLETAGALRDWLAYIGRDATWRIALASVFGCASTQVPLPNDTALARGLLFVGAVTIGALAGRRLDRRKRRKQ